jgi:integrase
MEDYERMARRRFQDPKPFREGNYWWIKPWKDFFKEGGMIRKQVRIKVCPACLPERQARQMAAEILRPMNAGLETIGSATTFSAYVNGTYRPIVLPLLAATTQAAYGGVLRKHLLPTFGLMPLRDMTALTLQKYFSAFGASDIGPEVVLKIREVLSSVLSSAMRYDLLTKNPMFQVQIPKSKIVNRRKLKPHLTPEGFHKLLLLVDEPYSTMIYTAVFSGLRVSELIGLRWEDVHTDSVTVDECYVRGNWSVTKTVGSSATIGVHASVIDRLHRLRTLEVEINWGGHGAKKRFKVVRSSGPHDLVFQSIRAGVEMNDQNVLRRHLRPAAIKLGIDPKKATWRSMRTSAATWMVEAKADVKSVQAQMRHSRTSTTLDIYAQSVPEAQRAAVERTAAMVTERFTQSGVVQ